MAESGNPGDDLWLSRMWRWAIAGTAVLFVITALAVANSFSGPPTHRAVATPTPSANLDYGGDPNVAASDEADPAAGKELKKIEVTTTPSPAPSPTPEATESKPTEPSTPTKKPDPVAAVARPATDDAPAAPTPDNCPDGDYTSSRYDGRCGTAPVTTVRTPDRCPGGDYSGNAYDGSCGTAPSLTTVSNGSATATITDCSLDSGTSTQNAAARVTDPSGAGYTLVITIGDQSQTFPRVSGTHTFYFQRFATYSKLPCSARLV